MQRTAFTAFILLLSATVASAEQGVRWTTDYRQAAEQAAREHKLILLHFESDSCPPCRKLEANVFPRRDVADAVAAGYVAVKVNVDQSPEMARHYSVPRWPMDVIVTPMGQEVYRQISPQDSNEYIARLKETSARAASTAKVPTANTTKTVGFQSGSKQSANDLPSDFQGLEIDNGAPTTAQKEPVEAQPAQPQVNEYVAKPQTSPYSPRGVTSAPRNNAAPAVADEGSLYEGIEPVSPRSVPNRGSTSGQNAVAPPAESSPAPAPPSKEKQLTPSTPAAQDKAPTPPPAAQTKAPILPPLGMEGYCVVSLYDYNKKLAEAQEAGVSPDPSLQGWVKGNKKFGAVHRGRLYLFANAEAQKTFLADPDRYAPALSGYDPVVFNETQKLVDGKRSIGLCYNGQVYCFASEESLQKFIATPKPFAETVYQAMLRSDKAKVR